MRSRRMAAWRDRGSTDLGGDPARVVVVGNPVTVVTPDRPASRFASISASSQPSGVAAPTPVIQTGSFFVHARIIPPTLRARPQLDADPTPRIGCDRLR